MNIYLHPEPKTSGYFHMMYYTNKAIFDSYLQTFLSFFGELNQVLGLKSFPLHAEFKLQDGQMIPIELNPMRYGGFGLDDLTYFSYDYHPIAAYFADKPFDWPAIWQSRAKCNYAWILGYNGRDICAEECVPNHHRFKSMLTANSDLLSYVPLDHRKNPVFALAYLKNDNLEQLKALLNTEFNDFFD